MKLSFWTLGTPDWSNSDVADAAQRFGYQGVDLRCGPGRNVALGAANGEVEGLKQLFASRELAISSLLAYNQRGSAEGVDWPAVTADIVAHVELANRLETQYVRVNAGCPAEGEAWEAYLEGFAEAVQAALNETSGAVLNVQNHPGSITAEQAGRLASMMASDRFGVGLSPDHCLDMDEDLMVVTEAVAPWVRQLYVADRVRLGEGGLKACLPGTGIVPTREVLGVLARHDFDGWVSFKWEKPTYPDLPDAEVALPYFVASMASMD